MNRCEYAGCGRSTHLHRVRFTGALAAGVRLYCSRHAFGWRGAAIEPLRPADAAMDALMKAA